jgi:ketosteroid isomerase-like protein
MNTHGQVTRSGTETVKLFMDCVNKGDMPGALKYVDADVSVTEPASMPYGGDYSGHAGFVDLMGKISATWAKWRETPNRYAENGGLVFRECTVRAILRDAGREVEMPFIEMFEVTGGLITVIRPHYWDPGLLQGRGSEEKAAS